MISIAQIKIETDYVGMSVGLVHRGYLSIIKTACQAGDMVLRLLTDRALLDRFPIFAEGMK